MAYNLSWLKIEEEVSMQDSLPGEELASIEDMYVYEVEKACIGNITELMTVHFREGNFPWYADFANNLSCDVPPLEFTGYTKKKFIRDVQHYY